MNARLMFFLILGIAILTGLFNIFSKSQKQSSTLVVQLSPTPSISIGQITKTTECKVNGALPDKECTPGTTDRRVSQDNIQSTICIPGYTKTVRPPVSVTEQIKKERMQAYGDTDSPANYELDHLIPLELGGCPDCLTNLWPEPANPTPGYHEKDKVENYLHEQVCSGALSLQQAQMFIAIDWLNIYQKMQK